MGRIGRPHGVAGHVVVRPMTDNPDRFAPGGTVRADSDPPRELVILASRDHRDGLVVTFEGVADRTAAEELRGALLSIAPEERRELGEDEFWPDDLAGIAALAPDGTRIGTVAGVRLGGSQDRLVVTTTDGREAEVPFVDELVGEVHPSGGFVVLRLPDGLLDPEGSQESAGS